MVEILKFQKHTSSFSHTKAVFSYIMLLRTTDRKLAKSSGHTSNQHEKTQLGFILPFISTTYLN